MIINGNWFLAVIGWFAPIKPLAMAIWPFVIKHVSVPEYGKTVNHENIHLAQYGDLWIVGFPFVYFSDYRTARKAGYSKEKAYKRIRFEQEAYAKMGEEHYLNNRPRNAWKNYTVLEQVSK